VYTSVRKAERLRGNVMLLRLGFFLVRCELGETGRDCRTDLDSREVRSGREARFFLRSIHYRDLIAAILDTARHAPERGHGSDAVEGR
jgi:hypothetical protein